MTELDAFRWVQSQPGLRLYVGHTVITLTIEGHVHVEGATVLECVIAAQDIIKNLRKKSAPEMLADWQKTCDRRSC